MGQPREKTFGRRKLLTCFLKKWDYQKTSNRKMKEEKTQSANLQAPQLVTGHGARKGFAGLGRVFGNDPSNFVPPWPLWNDWHINETVWDLTANELKMRSAAFTASADYRKSEGAGEPEKVDPDTVNLLDYTGRTIMPTEIEVAEWKRPRELTEEKATDYYALNLEQGDLDLDVNNKHLFRYKSMRHIISTVCCLERATGMYPYFPEEFLTSTDYTPNTGPDWHPWQHVYAMTKVGSGSKHMPKYNPYGMYYVRIFYMGGWRKVTVDDYIPLNSKGEWLLPRSKDTSNLWMPLLTKALLKVASISRTENFQFSDFNVINALTGYICLSLNSRDIEPDKLWRILECQIKPSKDAPKEEVPEEPDKKIDPKTAKGKKPAGKPATTTADKKGKKEGETNDGANQEDEEVVVQLNFQPAIDVERGRILKLDKSTESIMEEVQPKIVVCEYPRPLEFTELPESDEFSEVTVSEEHIFQKKDELSDPFTISESSVISESTTDVSEPRKSIGLKRKKSQKRSELKETLKLPESKLEISVSSRLDKTVSAISDETHEESEEKSEVEPKPAGVFTNVDEYNKYLKKVGLEELEYGLNENEQDLDERIFESTIQDVNGEQKPEPEKAGKMKKDVKEKPDKNVKKEEDKTDKNTKKEKRDKSEQDKTKRDQKESDESTTSSSDIAILASEETSLDEESTEDSDIEDTEETLERRALLEEGATSEGEAESLRFCVATDTPTCINESKEAFAADPGSTIVLIYFHDSKKNEDINLPLTYEGAAYVYKLETRKIPYYLPAWKMLRWAQFAYDFNIIQDMPGSIKREILLYIPLRRRVDDYNQPDPIPRIPLPILPMRLDFDKIVNGIWRLDIYYRPSSFKHASYTIELTGQPTSNDWSPTPVNLGAIRTDPDAHRLTFKKTTSLPSQCFYLCSDSLYCKNIFVTLSVFNPRKVIPGGYLLCERFSWSNPNQGKLLFSLRTVASKTYRLDLGPGLQVCRFFYKLVLPYYVQIHSDVPFMVGNKEFIQQYCLPETQSYQIIGEEMSERFSELVAAAHNSEGLHGYALERFKSCFLPWCLRRYSIPANDMVEGRIIFDNVLEDKVVRMIFENVDDNEIPITILRFRIIFLDDQFGENFLNQYGQFVGDIRRQVKLLEQCELKEELLFVDPKNIYSSNERRKVYEHLFESKKLKVKRRFRKKLNGDDEGEEEIDPNLMFHLPENCIKLLKTILEYDREFASMYPSKYDAVTNNVYRDYKGTTDVIPTLKWAVIARFYFNVHSEKPIPCSFSLTCNVSKVVLVVYDLDAEELIYTNYDPNYTYYFAANRLGYVVLAHGFIDRHAARVLKNQIPWRLRVLGKSKDDLPHYCTLLEKGNCEQVAEENHKLCVTVCAEYYLPNLKNVIGRFSIFTRDTRIVTLLLKISNEKVNFLLTLTGANDKVVAEVSGVGQVMIPAVLLSRSAGIKKEDKTSFSFSGKITLLHNSWPLSTSEMNFIEVIKTRGGAKPIIDLMKLDVKVFGAYWCLTMVYNETKGQPPRLFTDTSMLDKFFIGLKLSVAQDPGRVQRGRNLRREYMREFGELTQSFAMGILEDKIFDKHNLLPPKQTPNITDVLLQKYANDNEYLLPCIFDKSAQKKVREVLAEGRERLSRTKQLATPKQEYSTLNAVMKKQKEINQEIDKAITNIRDTINATMKESYEDRDTFIHEQLEIAKRMAIFAEEEEKQRLAEEKKEKPATGKKTAGKKKKKK